MRTIFHGIRQRAPFDVFQAQVIPLWGMHAETGFDASEAIMTYRTVVLNYLLRSEISGHATVF